MSADADDFDDLIGDFVTESREHLATVETDLLRLEEAGGDPDTVNKVFRAVHSVKGVAGFLGLQRINELAHVLESTLDLVRKDRLEPSAALVEVLLAAIDRLRDLVEAVHESNDMDIAAHLDALRIAARDAEGGGAVSAVAAEPARASASHDEPPPTGAAPTAGETGADDRAHEPAVALPASAPIASAPVAAAPPTGAGAGTSARGAAGREPRAETGIDSIRVSVSLLDRMMNLSGELVLGRNQLLQARNSSSDQGLDLAAARINQVVSEMQEAIMQTRLQPVGTVFQKFPRVVRDLASKLGKRARLVLEGREVELDRSILEALGDPLTHLVRNSVDHGIELPAVRQQRGKNPEGTLLLQATQQGGNVKILIVDDGGGIDAQKLRSKAVEKGLVTAEQAKTMGDRDAIMLIFAAGFSTAEKLTDVSGRGVGMDVVRTNIEKLGGSIDVQSQVGRGTTISVTIPLTLAILPALVVSCGACRYVLPQANVAELVRIPAADAGSRIVQVKGRDVLRLRGKLVPIVHLREVLGLGTEADRAEHRVYNIMVLEGGVLEYGLVVDTPPDAEEIVVKPLGRHLKGRSEYAGSTILGDGRVAMILDVGGIAGAANLRSCDASEAEAARDVAGDAEEQGAEDADLVLFRNHPEETFAVPLGLVSRIERYERSKVTAIAGGTVYSGDRRAMPLVRLDGAIEARQPEESGDRISVLVLRLEDREFGLIAPIVEDIRTMRISVDDRTLVEDGVLGSFQLQGRSVRLLDAGRIARQSLPRLFTDRPAAPEARAKAGARAQEAPVERQGPVRVLFAEDSSFFRNHVQKIMVNAGFEVTAAEDGDRAWEVLLGDEGTFDLVVTDIQMPNCDGLELTRRIRRSEAHKALPVLALTSLSSAEDVDAGKQAGITDYRVKLDDAALVAAIRELTGQRA
ncbi:MAG: chemotaxis protein CheW [Planctomycetota bacterium]